MKYKEIYNTIVSKDVMLWQIAPYNKTGIPTNSIFFKGRCGIGGTTMEMDQKRHSIIVVPNVSPIKGKCTCYNEMLGIKGEKGLTKNAKIKRIQDKLQTTNRFIKIMVTTDSFDCVIDAAQNLGKLEWLYENFFLLLDECHAYITESFRENITLPFRYFWNFKNKSLISATPFEFSDPLFTQLSKHEIIINERLGSIEVIEVDDIDNAVHFLLTHPDKFPGNVHIFYNVITKLYDTLKLAISHMGDLDCNLYFSKSDENLKKIGDLSYLFKEDPIDKEYKKYNLYTSKYAEAWDLNDPNATIILVTDVNAPHTKVGITNKGVQTLGRLRNKANRILHFTNHSNKTTRKGMDHFKQLHEHYATDSIIGYNIHANRCKIRKLAPFKKLAEAAEEYGEVSQDFYTVKKEHIKVDRLVNHDSCNEEYNNMSFIKSAWEASNYNVWLRKTTTSTIPNLKNLKVKEQLKLAVKMIHELELNKTNLLFNTDYEESKSSIIGVNKTFELAFKAYYQLGKPIVEGLGFDKIKIKAALVKHATKNFQDQILTAVKEDFKIGQFYSNDEIKSKLKIIYSSLSYSKNPVGTDIDLYVSLNRNKYGIIISSFTDRIN